MYHRAFHAQGHGEGGCAAIVGLTARDKIYVVSNSNTLFNAALVNQTQANAGNAHAKVSVRGRAKPLFTKIMPSNEGKQTRNNSTHAQMKFDLKR